VHQALPVELVESSPSSLTAVVENCCASSALEGDCGSCSCSVIAARRQALRSCQSAENSFLCSSAIVPPLTRRQLPWLMNAAATVDERIAVDRHGAVLSRYNLGLRAHGHAAATGAWVGLHCTALRFGWFDGADCCCGSPP